MSRLTKRITENLIELSAKANPTQYVNSPQRVHLKHPFWNVFNRLCDYEDLEEQGLLLKLPCKVGDTVWTLQYPEITKEDGSVWTVCDRKRQTVVPAKFTLFMLKEIGVYYFLTKEEAEKELQRIKGNG